MKRLLILIYVFTVLLPLSLHAQALPFLYCPSDSHTAALGGASVALEADTWTLEHNFAATALSRKHFSIGGSYVHWAPKTGADNRLSAEAWFRSGHLAFGLSAKGNVSQPYESTTPYGEVNGTFQPSDYALAVGAAWAPMEGLAVSGTFRMVLSSLAETARASAFGADIALKYEKEAFQAGLSVCNFGTPVNYGGEYYAQPCIIRIGAAYSVSGLTASAEADYLFTGGLMAGLGLEYTFANIVSLRGGFHYGNPTKTIPTYVSLGLGVQFASFRLDAAFLTASKTLGNTLMVGLGYSF